MVWIDYRTFGEFGSGAQHIHLWLGICGVPTIECCLAHLRRKNTNMVDGSHANRLHRDQLNRCLAMAVLARCRTSGVAYTFLLCAREDNV